MATDHNFKVKNGLVVEGGEIFVQGTTTPQIYFNGSADSGIDLAIKATPESLDFYEPEDNNKLHMRIVDDAGVNAVFGVRTGVNDGTLRIDGSGNLTNIGTISSGAITSSGNLSITAGSGQRFIEIASGTTNAKTYRIYNGISWNPDALLIYNHTDDSTVLTIEPGKLGVNRGANSLSHTLDVGGTVAISGNQIIDSSRNITAGTISSGNITTSGTITSTGSSNSSFYAITLSRSGSGTTTPDIWGTNGTFVIGTSSTDEVLGMSGTAATFYGTLASGAFTSSGSITSAGLTVDYTGHRTGDAGILVTNDASDWGIKVDKDGTADYGIVVQTDGENAIVVRNAAGVNKIQLQGDGDASFEGTISSTVSANIGIRTNYGSFAQFAGDSQIDVVSSSAGTWGSAVNLVEGNNTSNTDVWSMARKTTGGSGDSSLHFNFGTSNQHDNTSRVSFSSVGAVTSGGGYFTGVSNRAFHATATSSYVQVGPNSGGASGVFGAHRLTTSSGLDYTTYIGYDCRYEDATQKWYANRTNLGRKWKTNFGGYHQNRWTISVYDGGGTSGSSLSAGWLEADWEEVFGIDATGAATFAGTISSGAITADGGSNQSVIKSSSDAPLIVESTDAYSGINFKDTGGNSSMFYHGTSDHLYLNSAKFSVAGSTIATGYQLQVNGSANLTGSLAIGGAQVIAETTRNLTNIGTISSGQITTPRVNISDATAPYIIFTEGSNLVHMGLDNGGFWIRQNGLGGGDEFTIASNGNVSIAHDLSVSGTVTTGGLNFTGDLELSSTTAITPAIKFNNNSGTDTGFDMAIRGNAEGLDFYEPEDGNKIHMRIVDDTGVNAVFGLRTGTGDGTLRIDGSGNATLAAITGSDLIKTTSAKGFMVDSTVDLSMSYYNQVPASSWAIFTTNNHADTILSTNLKVDTNHDIVVNQTHSTMKGSGIVFTGNGHSAGENAIAFYAFGDNDGGTAGDVIQEENWAAKLTGSGFAVDGSITTTDGTASLEISGDSSGNNYIIGSGEFRFRPSGTTVNKFVIGSNGNLTTAGTISSGAITSSGTVTGASLSTSGNAVIGTNLYFGGATNQSLIQQASTNLNYMADGANIFKTYSGSWGERARIDDNGLTMASSKGISSDGTGRQYNWRALANSSTSAGYVKIARIYGNQSVRFVIELVGRSTSYGDGALGALGYIVGQLNNDNNYDIVYYNHLMGTSEVVSEVGQVDVDGLQTDIYVQVGNFSELSAHAHISHGYITTHNTLSTSQPTGYTAANSEARVFNSKTNITMDSGTSLVHNGTTVLDSSRNLFVSSGASTGKFAVKSSGVHNTYDFYNNGTTYLNGSTIIDDSLDLTGSNRALKVAGVTVIDSSRNITANALTISGTASTKLRQTTAQAGAVLEFSDEPSSWSQNGTITFRHSDTQSYGSGAMFEIGSDQSTTSIVAKGKLYFDEGLYTMPSSGTGVGTEIIDSSRNIKNINTIASGPITITNQAVTGAVPGTNSSLIINAQEAGMHLIADNSGDWASHLILTNQGNRHYWIHNAPSTATYNANKFELRTSTTTTAAQIGGQGTGSTAVLVVDSSGNLYVPGNLGVGTDTPGAKLEVRSAGSEAGGAEIRLQHANNNTNDVVSTVNFANNVGSVAMIQGGTTGANNTGYISFHTDNAGTSADRLRLTHLGNLHLNTGVDARIQLGTSGTGATSVSENSVYIRGNDDDLLLNAAGNGKIIFTENTHELMRMEPSGDWMVGNTVSRVASQYNNQAGIGWRESDHHFEVATTYNRSAAEFGRNNANSGDVITIRQQGVSIGMIGTEGGDSLVIQSNGSTGSGLRFHANNASIQPVRQGVTINNTIDLGSDTRRFKDIYLQGTLDTGDGGINSGAYAVKKVTGTTSGAGVSNGVDLSSHVGNGTTGNDKHNYIVELVTYGTGTDTGACYIVYYLQDTNTWQGRAVSLAGDSSNHPLLDVTSAGVVTMYTNHTSAYNIQAAIYTHKGPENDSRPHVLGPYFQWQRRDDNHLYYLDGDVGIGTNNPSYKLQVHGTGKFTGDLYADGNIIMDGNSKFLVIENHAETECGIVFNDGDAGNWPAASSQAFKMQYHCGNETLIMGHDDDSYAGFSFGKGGLLTTSALTVSGEVSLGNITTNITTGPGTQSTNSDANISIREGNDFAGLDFHTTRTSGNIGGSRYYSSSSSSVPEAQLLVEVDGSYNFYNGTNGAEKRVKIHSNGRVTINQSTAPYSDLEVGGNMQSSRLFLVSTGDAALNSVTHAFQVGAASSTNLIMDTNELMARNNGSASDLNLNAEGGNVTFRNNQTGTTNLVMSGTTFMDQDRNLSNIGNYANTDGHMTLQRTANAPLIVDRLGTTGTSGTFNGEIINFRAAGSKRGEIGYKAFAYGDSPYFATYDWGLGFFSYSTSRYIQPCDDSGAIRDNQVDLGSTSARFDDVYATNGTIQTSDRNEKQDIQALTDAETRVATACKGLIRRFRWVDSVTEKGDDARYHFGAIAQDVESAFTAEGLDAGKYGLFIRTTWWEHEGENYPTAEVAPTGAVEKTRLGIRYNQLFAFIISAL